MVIICNKERKGVYNSVASAVKDIYGDELKNLNAVLLFAWKSLFTLNEIKEQFPDKKIILFQTEQLVDYKSDLYNEKSTNAQIRKQTKRLKGLINQADAVWDYSVENIEFIKKENIIKTPFYHVPIPYSETLVRQKKYPKKQYDVLFYGSMNKRRLKYLRRIKNAGLGLVIISSEIYKELAKEYGIEIITQKYGNELWDYIEKSKIVFNCHFYPGKIQEQVRLAELIANDIKVVSEKSKINYFHDCLFEFTDKKDLLEVIKKAIKTKEWNPSEIYKKLRE